MQFYNSFLSRFIVVSNYLTYMYKVLKKKIRTKRAQRQNLREKEERTSEPELFEQSMQLQGESSEVLNRREMAEAFTCCGCIIWRHKLIRPWKSQVSDTIRRRLIKAISHLSGLALPLPPPFSSLLSIPYLVYSLSLFRLCCTLFFLLCRRPLIFSSFGFFFLSFYAIHFFHYLLPTANQIRD